MQSMHIGIDIYMYGLYESCRSITALPLTTVTIDCRYGFAACLGNFFLSNLPLCSPVAKTAIKKSENSCE